MAKDRIQSIKYWMMFGLVVFIYLDATLVIANPLTNKALDWAGKSLQQKRIELFFKANGYQATILKTLCPEVYLNFVGGVVPPRIRTAGSKKLKFTPMSRFQRIAEHCREKDLIVKKLQTYWNATDRKIENFLFRLTRIVKHEPVIFFDEGVVNASGTENTERAIRGMNDTIRVAGAVLMDTIDFGEKYFSKPDYWFNAVSVCMLIQAESQKNAINDAGSAVLGELASCGVIMDEQVSLQQEDQLPDPAGP